jgi:hypothetical protein
VFLKETLQPTKEVKLSAVYMLLNGLGLRVVGRVYNVSHTTISRRINEYALFLKGNSIVDKKKPIKMLSWMYFFFVVFNATIVSCS